MPSLNMPNKADPIAPIPTNPSTGQVVVMNPLSAPTGSTFDAKSFDPTTGVLVADPTNYSTGAMCTGAGFGAMVIKDDDIDQSGFGDDYLLGVTKPDGTAATDATHLYIGGGSSAAASDGIANTTPLPAVAVCVMGNGAERNLAGTSGTGAKMVTATGSTDPLDEIGTTGFANISGTTLGAGDVSLGAEQAP